MAEQYSVEAYLKATGADQFANAFKNATKNVDGLERSTGQAGLTIGKLIGAVGITAAVAKGFGMVKQSIGKAFGRIDTMEQFERVMTTLTGSSDKAAATLDNVREKVTGTAYGLDVAAQSVQGFVTSNMEVETATKTFGAWADAVAFYGDGTNATLSGVTDALAKATAKGKIQMDTMNRLAEAGIPAMQIYADATGKSVEEVADMMSKGKIDAASFTDVMNDAMINGTKNFKGIDGAAKEAGASWTGSFDNMRAAVTRGVVAIIQNIDQMLKDNGLPDMRALVADFGKKFEEVLKKVAENIPPMVERIKEVKTYIEPWIPLIQQVLIAVGAFVGAYAIFNTVKNMILGIRTAVLLMNAAMLANPVGLVIGIIAGLVAILVIAYNKVDWFRDMVDVAWSWIKNATSSAFGFLKDYIPQIISGIVSFGKSQLDKFRKFWDENGAQIVSLAKFYFGYLKGFLEMIMGVIKGIFQAVWPIIIGIIKVAWAIIKNTISTAINLVLGIIQTVLKVLQGDWKGAWTTIKNTAKQIGSDIVSNFKNLNLLQIGKDIIQGLVKGISSMAGAVQKAVSNVVSGIKSKITSALKIKSPSRVFMGYGGFISEGLAIGIGKMASMAERAANYLGVGVSDAFNPNLALGTSGIANQVNSINAQANRQLQSHLTSEINVSKQPARIVLQLGSNDFEVFVEDINSVNAVNATLRRF